MAQALVKNIFVLSCCFSGEDPSSVASQPRLPPHLSEHERDPLVIVPEVSICVCVSVSVCVCVSVSVSVCVNITNYCNISFSSHGSETILCSIVS